MVWPVLTHETSGMVGGAGKANVAPGCFTAIGMDGKPRIVRVQRGGRRHGDAVCPSVPGCDHHGNAERWEFLSLTGCDHEWATGTLHANASLLGRSRGVHNQRRWRTTDRMCAGFHGEEFKMSNLSSNSTIMHDHSTLETKPSDNSTLKTRSHALLQLRPNVQPTTIVTPT